MDRKLRKQLKSDKFAEEVGATVSWVDHHRQPIVRYGAVVVALALIVGGVYFYIHYQANAREAALADVVLIDNATVGPAPQAPGGKAYATQADKDKARTKAFADLAAKYPGTQEGGMAQMYIASDAADKGDLANAERIYKQVVDSAPATLAAMARLPLARIYVAEGKDDEAEKVLRYAVANPTATVSKEEATLQLAKVIVKKNPDEARKLLEPLRLVDRSAISRAAVSTLGEMAPYFK